MADAHVGPVVHADADEGERRRVDRVARHRGADGPDRQRAVRPAVCERVLAHLGLLGVDDGDVEPAEVADGEALDLDVLDRCPVRRDLAVLGPGPVAKDDAGPKHADAGLGVAAGRWRGYRACQAGAALGDGSGRRHDGGAVLADELAAVLADEDLLGVGALAHGDGVAGAGRVDGGLDGLGTT